MSLIKKSTFLSSVFFHRINLTGIYAYITVYGEVRVLYKGFWYDDCYNDNFYRNMIKEAKENVNNERRKQEN